MLIFVIIIMTQRKTNMAYIVVQIQNNRVKKETNDILIAYLNELGYDSFEEHLRGVDAYILEENFDEEVLKNLRATVPSLDFSYTWKFLEDKNWNQVWEDNYQPVVIADKLLVRSTFHEKNTALPYEVVINPQMSFGTGHHETTSLMLEALLGQELDGKKVLDVGCGTGILAIFAAQQGASVTGVDIDGAAYENALENIKLNNVEKIEVKQGIVDDVEENGFDIILANINRNVLLQDMEKYASRLDKQGVLFLSGFYEQDIPKLEEAITNARLKKCEKKVLNDWVVLTVAK